MQPLRFPDYDRHFIGAKDIELYQRGVYEAAVPYVRNFALAVDIGAHVGIWTRFLEEKFRRVVAIEPEPDNARCLRRNTTARVYEFPLSDCVEPLVFENPEPENSGAWEMRRYRNKGKPIPSTTLDELNLSPGLVKIDVQGFEAKVLRGAEKTLREHRPVVVAECWRDGHRWLEPEDILVSFGARLKIIAGKDQIFAWN